MPEVTQCPECQRKLNVADGQLGGLVRCPVCGSEFTAERYVPPRPAPAAPEPAEPEDRPAPRPRPRDDRDRDYDRRDDYDDRDYGRPRRRSPYRRGYDYLRPHRGSTVKTLGILSICFCWTTWPCWVMGGIALAFASQDLAQMDRGVMDDSGRAETQTGRTCAIIGLVLSGVMIFFCCGAQILIGAANH